MNIGINNTYLRFGSAQQSRHFQAKTQKGGEKLYEKDIYKRNQGHIQVLQTGVQNLYNLLKRVKESDGLLRKQQTEFVQIQNSSQFKLLSTFLPEIQNIHAGLSISDKVQLIFTEIQCTRSDLNKIIEQLSLFVNAQRLEISLQEKDQEDLIKIIKENPKFDTLSKWIPEMKSLDGNDIKFYSILRTVQSLEEALHPQLPDQSFKPAHPLSRDALLTKLHKDTNK